MNKLQIICKGENKLVNEVKELVDSGKNLPLAIQNGIDVKAVKAIINDPSQADLLPHVEAVVIPFMRPVLFIKNGQIDIPESVELRERIIKYKPIIEQPLNSVGRIELKNHQFKNIGTGWLIADNIMITNRHVAEYFAIRANKTAIGGIFRKNFIGDTINAVIDLKEEYMINTEIANQFEIEVDKVLYLPDSEKNLPDFALLRLKKTANLPNPIPFVTDKLSPDQLIGVVGYPFQDARGVTDKAMENRIFGDVFGVKRYALGQIINVPDNRWFFLHDASTLGGNSGSLVQDMETGCAIGLHFSGVLLEGNYAVKGKEILDIATKIGITTSLSFSNKDTKEILVEPDFVLEAPFAVANYDNRTGFNEKFLEDATSTITVKLPKIKNKTDIVKFGKKDKETILKYTHFSVEMSKSRRMCVYSAVNIDGQSYKRIKRTGWRFDPRIPEAFQIMKECYGNAPKFSRGHMTRREDPNWGDLAQQGNDDSMHVTNTVPQMQNFNAGVWLTLENYALENAKKDKQKICVFTGPFLHESDPIKFDVKVPVEFWKVIAFINDDTGKLCATGYTMSQEDFLSSEEFVFGKFSTYQTPIRLIEKKAGISFGELTALDPLVNDIFESINSPIQSLRQIRYF